MAGMDTLLFLKVLCDLERAKLDTVPDDEFVKEASSPQEQPGATGSSPYVVKVYMQKKYGFGGPLGSARYACPRCSCLFKHKRDLRQHLEFHCTHKCLGCSECCAIIQRSFQQVKGGERTQPSKTFSCSACPRSFLTEAGLAVHKECHPQPIQTFQCKSCLEPFDNINAFNEHQKKHQTCTVFKNLYKCHKCSKKFFSASNRKRHERVIHSKLRENNVHHIETKPTEGEGSVNDDGDEVSDGFEEASSKVCALCGLQFKHNSLNRAHVCANFPTLENLKEDMFKGHFQCPACSQIYSSYIALKMHWGCHLGLDPLTCTYCDKKLSKLTNADRHFELHGRNTCGKCGVFFLTKLAFLLHHCGFSQRCFTCDGVFPTRVSFMEHLRVHPLQKNSVFKCLECKKSFLKESYFRAHQIEHTGIQPFQCSLCDKKFLMFGPFKKHVIAHVSTKGLKCETCNQTFRTAKTFEAHSATHLVKVEFLSCENCHAQFESENDKKAHQCDAVEEMKIECPIVKETEQQPDLVDAGVASGFQCELCSVVFRKQHQLFMHLRDQHREAPPYLLFCDLCSKGFYHNLHLQSHRSFCSRRNDKEREVAMGKSELAERTKLKGKQFHCSQCGKKYFTQKKLEEHLYVHRDDSEFPHQCPKCGIGYVREYALKVHVQKCDSSRNSFRCKECGTTFPNEKALESHTKVHDKEWKCDLCHERFATQERFNTHRMSCKPDDAQSQEFRKNAKLLPIYPCPVCQRVFKLKHRFEAHVDSHKGILRYQCPTCFQKYMSSNNFKRHKCDFEVKTERAETLTQPDSPEEAILPD